MLNSFFGFGCGSDVVSPNPLMRGVLPSLVKQPICQRTVGWFEVS